MKAFDFALADSHLDTDKLSPADTSPERDFAPEPILVLLIAVALVAGNVLTQILDRSARENLADRAAAKASRSNLP